MQDYNLGHISSSFSRQILKTDSKLLWIYPSSILIAATMPDVVLLLEKINTQVHVVWPFVCLMPFVCLFSSPYQDRESEADHVHIKWPSV